MLILAVLCALAAGWCTGGRLSRFEGAGLRLLPLPVAALLLQRFLPAALDAAALLRAAAGLFGVQPASEKMTALFLGAGSLCNLTVIAANGWRMPVAAWAAALMSDEGSAALLSGAIPMYAAADAHTRLLFLGDIPLLPHPTFSGICQHRRHFAGSGRFFSCLMAVMAPSRLPRWLKCG